MLTEGKRALIDDPARLDGVRVVAVDEPHCAPRGAVFFVYTVPSRKAIASIKARVRAMTYRATLHRDPGYLMDYLGRVLHGWANYFRHGVSKRTFNAIDS